MTSRQAIAICLVESQISPSWHLETMGQWRARSGGWATSWSVVAVLSAYVCGYQPAIGPSATFGQPETLMTVVTLDPNVVGIGGGVHLYVRGTGLDAWYVTLSVPRMGSNTRAALSLSLSLHWHCHDHRIHSHRSILYATRT
jgi:hypothetical protein